MEKLSGSQKKYLRGLAHGIRPVVQIGNKGLTDTVVRSVDEALNIHELIKVQFLDFKEKEQKKEISGRIEERTGAELAGMIGHISIFYRQHKDPEKRKISVPKR